jgi:hypothetical protein
MFVGAYPAPPRFRANTDAWIQRISFELAFSATETRSSDIRCLETRA